tara:strand:- start:550 stop:1083 length:534 start_codon:yes stop_codon:yes gene_type:complete
MLGLGTTINLTTPPDAEVNYYTKNAWNFAVSSLQSSDYTESNVGTSSYIFDMDHNNDSAWYIYDDISSVATEGGSYTTTKVVVQFDIQIGNETGHADSNKFNVYLADSASGTQTLLKAYTNSDNTGGAYETQTFTLTGGSIDTSNDYINFKDNASSGSADWDFTFKNLSVKYYGIPT